MDLKIVTVADPEHKGVLYSGLRPDPGLSET